MLVRRMAAGDQSAMAELYDQTSALVFSLALRIVADHGAAEEVLLDVYAQAWHRAAAYQPSRGTPSAWLLNLTRCRAIDRLRAGRRAHTTEQLASAAEVAADAPSPEALSAAAEHCRLVRQALATLSAELREVIDLAYFGGLSHSEIADQLGQPLGTVKTRIRTAMMRLRNLLAPLNAPLPLLEKDRSR